jgi:ribosomal protein L25 (general stress protein Ctc)
MKYRVIIKQETIEKLCHTCGTSKTIQANVNKKKTEIYTIEYQMQKSSLDNSK